MERLEPESEMRECCLISWKRYRNECYILCIDVALRTIGATNTTDHTIRQAREWLPMDPDGYFWENEQRATLHFPVLLCRNIPAGRMFTGFRNALTAGIRL